MKQKQNIATISKNKFNLEDYIDKYIVLITNYTIKNTFNNVSSDIKVIKYKQKYVLARCLTKNDLLDEDFVDYMYNMWKHKSNLDNFLKNGRASRKNQSTK
jgi:hypothetical protein